MMISNYNKKDTLYDVSVVSKYIIGFKGIRANIDYFTYNLIKNSHGAILLITTLKSSCDNYNYFHLPNPYNEFDLLKEYKES